MTAKVLLHNSEHFFTSVKVYEQNSCPGGVWAANKIYDGLTTNSPLLTYEIPDFPYPKDIRSSGVHVRAQDVNAYFNAYARTYDLNKCIQYDTRVLDASWDAENRVWSVSAQSPNGTVKKDFSYIVVCVGLYHQSHEPLGASLRSRYKGNIFHSSDVGNGKVRKALADCSAVTVVGAGKSAIDLATLMAKAKWSESKTDAPSAPVVTLVYRRPHWLSPRKILRGTIPFEQVLFSRFVVCQFKVAFIERLFSSHQAAELMAAIRIPSRWLPPHHRRNEARPTYHKLDLPITC